MITIRTTESSASHYFVIARELYGFISVMPNTFFVPLSLPLRVLSQISQSYSVLRIISKNTSTVKYYAYKSAFDNEGTLVQIALQSKNRYTWVFKATY
jgi:hypothetical protein